MEQRKPEKNNLFPLFICAALIFICCGENLSAEALSDKSKTEEVNRAVRLMDYGKAAKLLSGLAASGDSDAQYRLGVLYQTGTGVRKNYTKALYFFKQAAEQGLAKAQYSLAQIFENGWGINPDYRQAFNLYQQAADKGYAQAQEKIKKIAKEGWPSLHSSDASKNESLSTSASEAVLLPDEKEKQTSPNPSLERRSRPWSLSPKYGLGFAFGILGTLCMCLLFIYSLRKRITGWEQMGSTKTWFGLHMVLGVVGPALILLHCNFRLGSLNSNMALLSTVIVAASGVIGRCIYARVHYDLYGELANLGELKNKFEQQKEEAGLQFAHILGAKEELFSFAENVLAPSAVLRESIGRFFSLKMRSQSTLRKIQRLSADYINRHASENNWGFFNRLKMKISIGKKAKIFINQALKIAEFNFYERLFSFWHILHIPLVFILFFSVAMHVFAANRY